jgi:peptidyl-prolyl cis-trans isomerase B (cyclophilin B)
VRIAAVRTCDNVQAALSLLNDQHELVRTAAIRIYLKSNGDPGRIDPEQLNPAQAEIMVSILKDSSLAKRFFNKEGLFREVCASFMSEEDLDRVLSSPVSDRAKIGFLENRKGKDQAIAYAKKIFQDRDSRYALQYLLQLKNESEKKKIVEIARKKNRFNSELQDFGYIKPSPRRRQVIFYRAVLEKISRYRGFQLLTAKGTIRCDFFHREAPLTCYNFIELAERRYYDGLYFHRVIPAFVSQDGDPTGTGSGGPGYSIPCEYNEIEYDREGRVGMALAGKDTGGSQYFITHLATPHLNHHYTIFAQAVSGINLLADIDQYDIIKEIRLY